MCFGKRLNLTTLWVLMIMNTMSASTAGGAEPPRKELLVRGPNLQYLTCHHVLPHAPSLQHLSLIEVPQLRGFEAGCLSGLTELHSLYIWKAPLLKKLPYDLLHPPPPSLRTLRIINCGLQELPDLSSLADNGHLLHMVYVFNGGLIVGRARIGLQEIIDANPIEEIENYAFEGSELGELSLKGNSRLKILHENSFAGIVSIRELDISGTAITHLPAAGLGTIERLVAENIISMKTIPSIHDFKNLREAKLTHHFHCCAFKFPERHDPERHEVYLSYIKRLKKLCSRKNRDKKRVRRAEITRRDSANESFDLSNLVAGNNPWSDIIIGSGENDDVELTSSDDDDFGVFHDTPVTTLTDKDIEVSCENFTDKIESNKRWKEVSCSPKSDALNPCEDVLGGVGARALGWTAGLASTLGNVVVAAVLLTRPLAPPRLLLMQLAIADLGTALYLVLIAAVDTHTADNYFNFAYDWQYGIGCKVAGFLAVWGAQASLLALAALTLERWLAITRALLPQRRLSPRGAKLLLLASTAYSLFIAAAPLFGASHYSSTSICLPMRRDTWVDILYLSCLLCGGLFCLMAVIWCYVHIYMTLAKDTPRCTNLSGDLRVANKMAILIAIHMACCVPVAAVGFGALIDHPIVGVHGAKLLLVLIYPLNALADPFLYAMLTHQFRRDLYLLLDRYGMCTRRAQQYKVPGVIGRERRQRRTSLQMIRRPDGSLTTAYEDLLV